MRVPTAVSAAAFIAIVPGSIGGWIPLYIATGGSSAGRWSPDRFLGVVLVVAGWTILLWCTVEFVRRGRGTPSPNRAPTKLVVSGLFRFVRNPMYVGVVTAIEGVALAMHSWETALYGLVVAIAFHLRVLFYEEPRLTREFGDEFVAYRARVPRWIPRSALDPASRAQEFLENSLTRGDRDSEVREDETVWARRVGGSENRWRRFATGFCL